MLLLLRPRSHAAAEGASLSLSMQTHTIGHVQASFLVHTTGGAHINVWQEGKNGQFYEAKMALHFDW